jgi:hypothetical protein
MLEKKFFAPAPKLKFCGALIIKNQNVGAMKEAPSET